MDQEEMKRKVVVEDDEQVDEEEEEQVLMKEEEEEEEDEVNADTMLLGSGKGGEDAESDNGEEELDDMLEDDVVHLNVSAGTYEHALYGYDCFILRSKTTDEVETEGGRFGTHKLINVKARHLGSDIAGAVEPVSIGDSLRKNAINISIVLMLLHYIILP